MASSSSESCDLRTDRFDAKITPVRGGAHNAFPGVTCQAGGLVIIAYRRGRRHATVTGDDRGRLYTIRSVDHGTTWETPALTVDAEPADVRTGLLSSLADGRIALVSWTNDGAHNVAAAARFSQDNGASWSSAVIVPSGFDRTACESPLVGLEGGDLVVPVYGRDEHQKLRSVALAASTDDGATFEPVALIADGIAEGRDYNEAYLQSLHDGTLLCLIREDTSNVIAGSISRDLGRSWSTPRTLFPGSARPAHVEFPCGSIACFYRQATPSPTEQMMLARISGDHGTTWSSPVTFNYTSRMVYAQPVRCGNGATVMAFSTEKGSLANVHLAHVHQPAVPSPRSPRRD